MPRRCGGDSGVEGRAHSPAVGVMAAAPGPGLLDPFHREGDVAPYRLEAVGRAVRDVEDRAWREGHLLAVNGRHPLTADDIHDAIAILLLLVPCHDLSLNVNDLALGRQRWPARQAQPQHHCPYYPPHTRGCHANPPFLPKVRLREASPKAEYHPAPRSQNTVCRGCFPPPRLPQLRRT